MFYTNKSIRLHTRCLEYLELIQKANNRHEDKRSTLARYDVCRDIYGPLRLMYDRKTIVNYIDRMEKLSDWLVSRYQKVFTELGSENLNRLQNRIKEIDLTLSTNEV